MRPNFAGCGPRASPGPLSPFPARMTVKLGDGAGGEEGLKRLGKRSADEDSLEGEGPGGADAAEDGGGTKRDGKTPRDGGDGPQAPAGGPQAPSPPPAGPQDQHHFLRSSVRPQSKRLRKDSSCAGGSSGAGGSAPRGKGRGPRPLAGSAPRSPPPRLSPHAGSGRPVGGAPAPFLPQRGRFLLCFNCVQRK